MANESKLAKRRAGKTAGKAVRKPTHTWQQTLVDTGTVVGQSWHRYRASVFQGYVIIAIVTFIILAVLAKTVAYFTFDVTITHAVQSFTVGWFSGLMFAISWIGFEPQAYGITLLLILLLYASGLKWEAVVSLVSVAISTTLGIVLKILINRPRPSADLVKVVSTLHDYSFPSGHVLYFCVFFGFLLFLAYTLLSSSWLRTVLLIVLGALVTLVGLSRIYEGQHWASDVLASYLLGSLCLAATIFAYRMSKPRFSRKQPVGRDTPHGP